MTRQERLNYCRNCSHREFDFHRGILCGITHQEADFESVCLHYLVDAQTKSLQSFRNSQNEALRNELQEKKELKRRKREEKQERRIRQKKYPDKIQWSDIHLLAGIGLITLAIIRVIGYSDYTFSTRLTNTVSVYSVIMISAAAALLLRKKTHWRFRLFGDMKFKLLYAATITILLVVYHLVFQVTNIQLQFLSTISIFFLIFFITLLSVVFVIPLNLVFRKIFKYDDKAE